MGLFGTKKPIDVANSRSIPPMGSGLRLSSDMDVPAFLATLDGLLVSYRPRKYEALPHLIPAGSAWLDSGSPPPDAVVCCDDQDDEFLLFAFWRQDRGSDVGLFPLGSGDARLKMNIVGHLKMRDSSLNSVGVFAQGCIALRAPTIPPDFVESTLKLASYPTTQENLRAVAKEVFVMLLIKAGEFIGGTDSQSAAEHFVDDKKRRAVWSMDSLSEPLQSVLDGLAEWNPAVLPYIQELPLRIRAIMLDGASNNSSFWQKLQR